jgi:hypothetical protein
MLKQENRPETIEPPAAVACRHHWIIEPAVGPVSEGSCRKCGVHKEFKNYLEETPWREWTSPTSRGVDEVLSSIEESVSEVAEAEG